jgi:hypothetical protein
VKQHPELASNCNYDVSATWMTEAMKTSKRFQRILSRIKLTASDGAPLGEDKVSAGPGKVPRYLREGLGTWRSSQPLLRYVCSLLSARTHRLERRQVLVCICSDIQGIEWSVRPSQRLTHFGPSILLRESTRSRRLPIISIAGVIASRRWLQIILLYKVIQSTARP